MDIDKIVEILINGGILVIPTDTVYGIVGDATREDVIHKVYKVKNRDYNKPMIVNVSSRDMLDRYVKDINEIEEKLINEYWPGRLTILLKKKDTLSNLVTSNSELVGVRIPDNEDLIQIIERLGRPIISTSANLSASETITSAGMLEQSIKDNVDYIYDGGEVKNVSSTIVKVVEGEVVILRRGDLAAEIEEKYKN